MTAPSGELGRPGQEVSSGHAAELDRVGPDYWWHAVRLEHVEAVLGRLPRPFRYLDFGCGAAVLTGHLIERFEPSAALGLDGTHDLLRAATARGVPVRYADFRAPLELPFAPEAITALDVLEHLDDPVGALRHLAAVCAENATLVATVPAMPSLTSRWDELAGHRRRYTRAQLRAHLRAGRWRPLRVRYVFSYAVAPLWLQRSLLRRVGELRFPRVSSLTNGLLTGLGRLERRLGAPLPFGTSLVAVARRDSRARSRPETLSQGAPHVSRGRTARRPHRPVDHVAPRLPPR